MRFMRRLTANTATSATAALHFHTAADKIPAVYSFYATHKAGRTILRYAINVMGIA
jgi:hypothetical protein